MPKYKSFKWILGVWNLLFAEELSFLLNDQKKRNKKKSPANILGYPLLARLRNKRKHSDNYLICSGDTE